MSQGGDGQFKRGEQVDGTQLCVVGVLGSGGMGTVYEVEHVTLGKHFVLKVLHGALLNREDLIARMQNEWRMLAQLEHPHIVRVTDAGYTSSGLPFYVMERLEGETLGARLRRQERLEPAEIGEILLEVLAGLEAAHAAGAIHRDIKPENIFLTSRGAKILDFGIAKLKSGLGRVQTKNGVAVGTPRYMAPEQAQGGTVDARTDVYAVGLLLYEALAGRSPFAKIRDPNDLVMAHINEEPARLDLLGRDIAAELADLAQRWLSKDPSSRPPSARAAGLELEALLCGLVETVRNEDDSTASCGFGDVTVGPGADWGFASRASLNASAPTSAPKDEASTAKSCAPPSDNGGLARTVTLEAGVMERSSPPRRQGVADARAVKGLQPSIGTPREAPTAHREAVGGLGRNGVWSRAVVAVRERLWRQPVLWTVCLSGATSFAVMFGAIGYGSEHQEPEGLEVETVQGRVSSEDKPPEFAGEQVVPKGDSLRASKAPQMAGHQGQRAPTPGASTPTSKNVSRGEPSAPVAAPARVQPSDHDASSKPAVSPTAVSRTAAQPTEQDTESVPSSPDFPASGLW